MFIATTGGCIHQHSADNMALLLFIRGNDITFTITSAGSDYVAGAATTTGGGDGNMTVTLTVNGAGGIATGITIDDPGAGYVIGDVVTVANNGAGGAGGTFTLAAGTATTFADIYVETG